ncbi:olfactory receptor 52E4-like [Erpetoichthys calabaricus]|uniref:olfactory receptor 52E4-like n=1 Tax=Erpetoichthys calabaricus TaxID=27687 RepID=UPI0010A0B67A|nr:olfactory receptor 52E4-like [Erpetoichthys calabaricus]
MPTYNTSSATPDFFLIGFPGLEDYHHWLSVPFTFTYLIAILGNVTIILIVKHEENLHMPMYVFLCVLAVVDLGLSTSVLPEMLNVMLFNIHVISFQACFLQMFLVDFFSGLESSILAVMAYDRYVAIYRPLHYTSLLTATSIVKILTVLLIRCLILTGVIAILASRLPYCSLTNVSHCYCYHIAVAKLACTDITLNSSYGLFVAFLIIGTDLIFIAFTYVKILKAVLKLGSKAAQHKAFNTCGSHLFIILYYYSSGLFSFLTNRFGESFPQHIKILLSVLYLIVPPALNPIIYGLRTKEIREVFHKYLFRTKIEPMDN